MATLTILFRLERCDEMDNEADICIQHEQEILTQRLEEEREDREQEYGE